MATFKTLGDSIQLDRARRLRRERTEAEARLWQVLGARRLGGWQWRRQVPRGPFIVDFLCIEAALVVEVDGGQHAEQIAYDERRTAYLDHLGLRVLRFWNHAVMTNRDGVCLTILAACGGDHPSLALADPGAAAETLASPLSRPSPLSASPGGEELDTPGAQSSGLDRDAHVA
jgi:very-short-patch-repair endonuclease